MPQSRTCHAAETKVSTMTLLSVKDHGFQDCEEDDEPFSFPSELLDGPVLASFEDESIAIPMALMEIYQQLLSHESILLLKI